MQRSRSASSASSNVVSAYSRQEKLLLADPKYKKYQAAVERSLALFESVAEWADFITFLAKLLKTLQAYPQFQIIPHRLTVAKRLAQCLNPALPTGVHQRALDVYVYILNTIGPDNLRHELAAWSSGLFPFFQYAATSVRPIVLGIYSKFYLPLSTSLRPCTKAFILALLPGVDEETSEFFDKVSSLLDSISTVVSPSFFFQHLWLILITSPSSRVAALNYLSKRLPKVGSEDDLTRIVGQDVGLMVRAFASAVDDGRVLVQRGILDLLLNVIRLDGSGWKNQVREQDQKLLMKSLLGVVLKRDLSLSRRLHHWLLGSTDAASEKQVEYLKDFGLDVVCEAMREEMRQGEQRPFRILLALLDKWEIGYPVTEALVLDAFRCLKDNMHGEGKEELRMTAGVLWEGLDPYLTWKMLFGAVKQEMESESDEPENIDLVIFVLKTFKLHDEEILRIHLPVFAYALLELLEASLSQSSLGEPSSKQRHACLLLHRLLDDIPVDFYSPSQSDSSASDTSSVSIATTFYSSTDIKQATLPLESLSSTLLCNGLACLLRMTKKLSDSVSQDESTLVVLSSLLDALSLLPAALPKEVALDWRPQEWLSSLLRTLEKVDHSRQGFEAVSQTVQAIAALQQSPIQPALNVDTREAIRTIVAKLLSFLTADRSPLSVETVRLIWLVHSMTRANHVEAVICEQMTSRDERTRIDGFDAFGNLWRTCDDSSMPTTYLSAPLFLVLDGTRSEDAVTRRAAEAWMRCSFKSYLRLLDPLLVILLSPDIRREALDIPVFGQQLNLHQYIRPFDQARCHYALKTLHHLFLTRGAGFQRTAKGAQISSTSDVPLKSLAAAGSFESKTYLDAICLIMLQLLSSDPAPHLDSVMNRYNLHIQVAATDVLQVIVQRGDLDQPLLNKIQVTLLSRLLFCVEKVQLDLQNKLLHALHATFQGLSTYQRKRSKGSRTSTEIKQEKQEPGSPHETLLLAVLTQGISKSKDSATVHYWVDFLFMSVAQLKDTNATVLMPLVACLTDRVTGYIDEIEQSYDPTAKGKKPASNTTETDFVALVGALERLTLLVMEEARSANSPDPGSAAGEHSTESGGFLGYVTGVLGSSEGIKTADGPMTKSPTTQHVEDVVRALLRSWEASTKLDTGSDEGDMASTRTTVLERISSRTRKCLERLYKASPSEIIEDTILFQATADGSRSAVDEQRKSVFAILGQLASAQAIVSSTCELLRARLPPPDLKHRVFITNPDLTYDTAFDFLESYLDHLESSGAVQVWPPTLAFAKDMLSQATSHRFALLPTWKCFNTLSEKIAQTSALVDRRMRRDLQDTMLKLADVTIPLANRGGIALRKVSSATGALSVDTNGIAEDEKSRPATPQIAEEKNISSPVVSATKELTDFLAKRFLPNLKRFLLEADKVNLLCGNIMYYCVNPAFRNRAKSFSIDAETLDLLREITKHPAAAKGWRAAVSDVFSDNRFFNSSPSISHKWKPIVHALMTSDKERFPDLIQKVSTASSANIFTNRDLEMLSRALSLRRLSYAILAGEKNAYLIQLPAIQEKLVEILRANVGEIVHSEVYLCLRVLLCSISEQHLSSLWPIILTELLRLFENLLEDLNQTSSEYLQLILSACKFLDLLLVLQTEDFQIHQWMFVTDTVDAIYPPADWSPQAIVDRLSELMSKHVSRNMSTPQALTFEVPADASLRRPILATARLGSKLDSLAALEPFFSRISLSSYESIYACQDIDWTCIIASIEGDIFEG